MTQIIQMKISDIKPYEKNPRNNDKSVQAVANSIKEFGFRNPIITDADHIIIAGHTRYKAAKKLGLKTVPVIIAEDLTPQQAEAYRIADNSAGSASEWDLELLADILPQLDYDMADFGLDITFNEDEEGSEPIEIIQDEALEPDLTQDAVTKPGDIWKLGNHRLMCGDSTDKSNIDRLMADGPARLTVTSPPYGVGMEYEEKGIEPWRKTISGVIEAIAKHTLIIVWNIGDLYATEGQFIEPTSMYSTEYMDKSGFGMLYARIWKKPGANFAGVNPYHLVSMKPVQEYEWIIGYARRDYYKSFEKVQSKLKAEAEKAGLDNNILKKVTGAGFMYGHWFTLHQFAMIDEENYIKIQEYCRENNINAFMTPYAEIRREFDNLNVFQKTLSDEERSEWGQWAIWEISPVPSRDGHPAAYPVELPARVIKMHTREGDTVLDPFGGSGTTLVACEQLGRVCRTIERDPHYCDVIIKRWENLTGKTAERIA